MKNFYRYIVLMLVLIQTPVLLAQQDHVSKIKNQLDIIQVDALGLGEKVELSVSKVSIQEFVRGIAVMHKLNISIDPQINLTVVNNFSNATVADVLVFLCKTYQLDITFTGNIMYLKNYDEPKVEEVPVPKRVPIITYNDKDSTLSLDLRKDSLEIVVKLITDKSGRNVVLSPGLENKTATIFIKDVPFGTAIEKFALTSGLEVETTGDNFYVLRKITEEKTDSRTTQGLRGKSKNTSTSQLAGEYDYKAVSKEDISIKGKAVDIGDVIRLLSDELSVGYLMISELSGSKDLNLEHVSYDVFLSLILKGTEYSYIVEEGVYVIGKRTDEDIRKTKVVRLKYRSVEGLVDLIPKEITKGVSIKEFSEQNSFILSGSEKSIEEIGAFLYSIDEIVPVVLMEVIIVDYSSTRNTSAGIEAGFGEKSNNGAIFPEINYTHNASSLNKIVNSIDGFGLVNLGQFSSNFYLSINALESQGVLKKRSTPKLATLNGHEATLSSGLTRYYVQRTISTIASNSVQQSESVNYLSTNADFSLTVKPYVSDDEQITMEIKVDQSRFLDQVQQGAPYNTSTSNFNSVIRVKNDDIVLLGGLEEKSLENSGSGVPFLSRIPVIKWFFSSRTNKKSNTKLVIFLRPTIIY